jgi:hypothetical protein
VLRLGGANAVLNGAALRNRGLITGTGRIDPNVESGGSVSPGDPTILGTPIGKIEFAGNLAMTPSGRVDIDIAGTGSGRFDQLQINNAATLDGTLALSLGGFVPLYGDEFTVMTFASCGGRFAQVQGNQLAANKYLATTYFLDRVLVTVALPGDSNLDGAVDISDLGILATNWQTPGHWALGDFDGSGLIDIADLGLLATSWQLAVGGSRPAQSLAFEAALGSIGLPASSVPEPVSLSATLIVLAAVLPRKRAPLPPTSSRFFDA